MEGVLTEAHTTFTAHKATSRHSQGEGGEWRAFTAHKATSHANTTGQRKKGWSAWGVREKKTHLGGGCLVDPWLAPLQWGLAMGPVRRIPI